MTYDKESRTITIKVSTLVFCFILFWLLTTIGPPMLTGFIDGATDAMNLISKASA